ncbi:MAG: cation-translocating P-type ATPase [Gemmatimonadota bacterium]
MGDFTAWHTLEPREALLRLGVDGGAGLSDEEAARRLAGFGPNELAERGARSPVSILLDQFASVMVGVLAAAAAVSVAIGEIRDAAVILAIVVLNALLGFRQEYRAEKAMAALKKLAVPTVRAIRGGRAIELSARLLVPGDVFLLEAGNRVPADGRLLEAVGLKIQEAALTGESVPVDKNARALPGEDLPPADRTNMAYMGTLVTYGRGRAVATGTGMKTALGAVAGMLEAVGRGPTPLQRRLAGLGRTLAVAALALVGVIFVLGLARGEGVRLMFFTAVSMAVAAVPEGLAAVVTVALALGAQRMLRRHALIRRLPAVEALGPVTVICADKTGTLTENRMRVVVVEAGGDRVDLRSAAGDAPRAAPAGAPDARPALAMLLAAGALCNDALPSGRDAAPGGFAGDPTEAALADVAARHGFDKGVLDATFPRVAEIPFDSDRRRMTTVHELPPPGARLPQGLEGLGEPPGGPAARRVVFTKGAVDGLLEACSAVLRDGRSVPLDAAGKRRIVEANEAMAREGMRVLGLAFRLPDAVPPEPGAGTLESGLTFLGLAGMADPPRPEAAPAVRACMEAGIRPLMITGDHPLTAESVARSLGIAGGEVLSGSRISALDDAALAEAVDRVSVFARVAPDHKLRIVTALQGRGHIVAMTGDGVNDAPALKKADIGVAMGAAGTDVAREAADMILRDDNFATIVAAIAEGRVVYDNIRKFLRYILMSNAGEILVMLAAPFLGMPLPLLPLQILWVNLVTDGLPALALGVEPAERDVMRRPPRPPSGRILSGDIASDILAGGALMGLASLAVGYFYWRAGAETWRTMVFTTVTLSQMGNVMAVRSERDSLFRIGAFTNRPLLAAVALTVALQMALVYLPGPGRIFGTVPLSLPDLALSVVLSSLVFWGMELRKRIRRAGGGGSAAQRSTA